MSKTSEIMREIVPDITVDAHLLPSQFIKKYWTIYEQHPEGSNSLNGNIFEELIAITLVRQGIMPFYMQATVAFIPNVNYDFVIYCEGIGPLVLSAKVSLRERYKQADLEALALKNVHRKSESYLISLNETEIRARKKTMDDMMALDDFIYALSDEYDVLLDTIRQKTIMTAPTIPVIESNIIMTADNFHKRWQ